HPSTSISNSPHPSTTTTPTTTTLYVSGPPPPYPHYIQSSSNSAQQQHQQQTLIPMALIPPPLPPFIPHHHQNTTIIQHQPPPPHDQQQQQHFATIMQGHIHPSHHAGAIQSQPTSTMASAPGTTGTIFSGPITRVVSAKTIGGNNTGTSLGDLESFGVVRKGTSKKVGRKSKKRVVGVVDGNGSGESNDMSVDKDVKLAGEEESVGMVSTATPTTVKGKNMKSKNVASDNSNSNNFIISTSTIQSPIQSQTIPPSTSTTTTTRSQRVNTIPQVQQQQDNPTTDRDSLRKRSHSAIEKRRRDRMNVLLSQLQSMVPSCARKAQLHKLDVLESAIQHIFELKKLVGVADGVGNRSDGGGGGEVMMVTTGGGGGNGKPVYVKDEDYENDDDGEEGEEDEDEDEDESNGLRRIDSAKDVTNMVVGHPGVTVTGTSGIPLNIMGGCGVNVNVPPRFGYEQQQQAGQFIPRYNMSSSFPTYTTPTPISTQLRPSVTTTDMHGS
ncbi:hypothetical protein HDU76_006064, partial [Blyttiomyces sp. JEL0837]